MSDDLWKLEERILALDPEQRAKLLRILIDALEDLSTANPVRIAESHARYLPTQDIKHLQTIVSAMLNDTSTEGRGTMEQFDRITQQPGVMGGRACVRGMRVTVGMIVGQIGTGASIEAVLGEYPYLEREDVLQALRYAAWRAEEREILLTSA